MCSSYKEKKIHHLSGLRVMASEQQNIYILLLITDALEQISPSQGFPPEEPCRTTRNYYTSCHKAESACLRFRWKLEQPLLKAS